MVLNEKSLFERLPHSMEPSIRKNKTVLKSGEVVYTERYFAPLRVWSEEKQKYVPTSFNRTIKVHGKAAAYVMVKRKMQEHYADVIPLLKYMERYRINLLK